MALDYPRVSDREYRRIRARVGLDRTYVENRCPRCGTRLMEESDDYGTGVRVYLVCPDDCGCGGERIS